MLKKIMVAQLARILEEWHCNSFTDLIDEMELWERGKQDFLVTIGTVVAQSKPVNCVDNPTDQKIASVLIPRIMSWAMARRAIWKCTIRIEKIGNLHVDIESTACRQLADRP